MALTNSIRVNRRWLDRLVYQVSLLDGHLAPMVPTSDVIALGNGPGVLGSTVRVEPRSVVVGLDMRPPTFRGRQEALDAIRQALAGLLEIETPDAPGRVLHAELQSVRVELYSGAHAMREVWVECTFLAVDPAREDVEPTVLALSTTPQPVPLGNDTVAPWLEISGGCTNPAVVIRNGAGVEVSRTTFAAILAANDALTIDSSTGDIERYVAGVRQTGVNHGLAAYASGPLPLLSPEDGAATIALEATGGTPVGALTYRRRW